ncbi:hypothetical protein Micbo1qcDRAFT_186512 [Microdochium bolleyi]|uniref:Uncharacterized protein n=1 Tax=Microdochium bolleyi TaxID=196109 RepID=A0A136ILW2_9PEZI|nr:hypothetical protein Micbo1qcDRAFT_186512 [Microdochium bolleyi]
MAETPIPILTVSLARHLAGHDIQHVLDIAWSSSAVASSTKSRFDNHGFNLNVTNTEQNLADLRQTLAEREWAGVILGWCVRGHAEFTEFFESVASVCVDHIVQTSTHHAAGRGQGDRMGARTRLIFCSGPDDLVNATLRTFPCL